MSIGEGASSEGIGGAIPLEAVREEYERYLRERGIDPATVEFEVAHEQHIAQFDGETRTITITVLTTADGRRWEWFPESPDWMRSRRRGARRGRGGSR